MPSTVGLPRLLVRVVLEHPSIRVFVLLRYVEWSFQELEIWELIGKHGQLIYVGRGNTFTQKPSFYEPTAGEYMVNMELVAKIHPGIEQREEREYPLIAPRQAQQVLNLILIEPK